MAKDRKDRYPTAAALGEEVQRWLADEPVSVYRDPWPDRVARWTRKHRNAALNIAAALVAVALIAFGAAVLVDQARIAEQEAKIRGHPAVPPVAGYRRYDADRGQQTLKYYPGTQQLIVKLLEKAAEAYEDFAGPREQRPRPARRVGPRVPATGKRLPVAEPIGPGRGGLSQSPGDLEGAVRRGSARRGRTFGNGRLPVEAGGHPRRPGTAETGG